MLALFATSTVRSVLLLALVATSNAQTYTSCNPLNSTCPSDPALGTSFNQSFSAVSSLSSDFWKVDADPAPSSNADGLDFTITGHGDSPTIQSTYYIFWGSVEVIMKAAPGQGIISSIVLLSDDLDEIDWEIKGGNTTTVETNYYGKGNTSESNAKYYTCDGPQTGFHNYTTVWTSETLEWHLDGTLVRTLAYADAVFNGESSYPQTPMYLKLGNWAAGDPSEPNGTITWAGGVVDYNDAPFTMVVQSVKVTDGTTNATSYTYGDNSGSFESIRIASGISAANQAINAAPPLSVAQRWNGMSIGARIAIIAVAGSVGLALILLFSIYCIKQRRAGRREAALVDAQWERDQADLMEQRRRWAQANYAKSHGAMSQVQEVGRW